MRIYLAARYSRRLEMCAYREKLVALGFDVQARWLDGEHQISDKGVPIGEDGESLVEGNRSGEILSPDEQSERAAALRQKFAEDDLEDVTACDCLIAFTEPPRSEGGRSRGGRHVELGIAIGQGKNIIVVGYRENIFCWLPEISFATSFEEARDILAQFRRAHVEAGAS